MEKEIKRFTERLYNETFGNGQGTLDEFDWEDIAMVIEETAHHFVNWQKERQPHWKPSEEQMEALKCAVLDVAKFSKRGGRQVELENEPYYKALHSLFCNLEKLM